MENQPIKIQGVPPVDVVVVVSPAKSVRSCRPPVAARAIDPSRDRCRAGMETGR